ncbi:type II toxin-antitoxin system VapC family toxin [Cyanobium sp. BA20m-p-22]|uniref:type II toxin-antitoxin system VapC family toxin n=1 Tax=Cyanobium sp. BA20m-p-22 TaxID=2823704 RepID=UPI0020CE2971|nr:type II toxin-antitoxin system VapC family toxin [Cyanobium sp. BA20m-p-22]
MSRAVELVDVIEPDRHLQAEALPLACHLDHPVYDCLYLALARREAALLVTAESACSSWLRGCSPECFLHAPTAACGYWKK